MSLRVICLVLFVATVNADLASVKTGLTNLRSSLADRIDRALSKTARGYDAIVASLDRPLVTADKRLGRVETAQSRIERSSRQRCPATWVKRGSLCYKFYKCGNTCSANDAKGFCKVHGATLASLKSAKLNAFVSSLVTGEQLYYAGATDEKDETYWRWADGSQVAYMNWAMDQPDDHDGNEDCLLVLRNKKNIWNDVLCSSKEKAGYVCEKKTK